MPPLGKSFIERLFSEHRHALEAFFHRRLRARQDAADLVQEVYLRMLRVKDADAIHNPEGYLFTVATHLVYEQSALYRRQAVSLDAEPDLAADAAEAADGFDVVFDIETRIARLRQVLAELPPKCRAAVHLKYQHGMSYEDIAGQLEISTHMVQKYLGNALAHCRRRMARMK
jgi:RNA polymerase sigma-70 factor (ECF subfamily)